MVKNSKTSAQMGRENRQKIINALKKIFRFDKNITKALKDSPKETVKKLADGTFDKGVSTKQKTNRVINDIVSKDKKEMPIKDQLSSIFSTSRNPNVAKDLTPIAKKPKVKSSMTQKEAARKRKSLLQTSRKTPNVSITIASIGIPKSRPEKPKSKKLEKKKTPTKKTQTLVYLKSGKKGTIAQRLAELDKEKALEKVKKLAQASLKKKKTRKA
tara:strand:+ start:170 stop:811 length:642 start_codon:yes stop_codon:yes gene_type:complete